ncbi:hypothetical protein F8271_14770 [Micromonospora sp. ALFpr18c]|uniref:hypothetical protein n=1 Tax=Micromonospora sp. ALFpr18c TaxID=1458665 RepID=UPI00124BB7A4|nr:hypothetical protein [Micromonospora sp. ALFpr18c]KAB1941152.1 hypothetical protein F8271_14770 [Micromonospora sp. ALFpr18c]
MPNSRVDDSSDNRGTMDSSIPSVRLDTVTAAAATGAPAEIAPDLMRSASRVADDLERQARVWVAPGGEFRVDDSALQVREEPRDNWYPCPSSMTERAITLCPYLPQGAGIFLKWNDENSKIAGPIYGTGIALTGLLGVKAFGEEAYAFWQKGGQGNWRRLAAGLVHTGASAVYGWYNAMGKSHPAGGFSAVVIGATAWYLDGQQPGRLADTREPILPLHSPSRPAPQSPNSAIVAAARLSTSTHSDTAPHRRPSSHSRPSSPPADQARIGAHALNGGAPAGPGR